MTVKESINTVLRRGAGVQLVRTDTIAALEERAAKARKKAKASRARTIEVKAEHQKLLKYARRHFWDLPPDYHPDMQRIWPLVKDRTMVGHEKMNYFLDAVRYITRAGIPGDIVECGVWRGGAMLGCALTLDALGDHSRDLYLYDTYEGMSEPTERDVHIWHGRTAEDELERRTNRAAPIWEPGKVDDVASAFDASQYPRDKIHFVKGKVEDTIPATVPEQIAILRLDTDWYESTRHELEHLYPRLSPGGILIIDDYGSWQGSRDATDEYFADHPDPVFLVRTGRGRAAVKPGLGAGATGS
ncbi:MAG: class I SAM-dependent methyltransferase [Aeromicrobium erythreum]